MTCKQSLALWIGLAISAFTSPLLSQESPPVLDYLAHRAARMASELPTTPDSLEAWEKQRGQIVPQLGDALGLPDRESMKSVLLDSRTEGDLVIEQVAYLWAADTYASATVIRSSKVSGRRSAMVITSGDSGHYTFKPYRKAIDTLARAGHIVLFIDDPRIGRRHAPRAGLYATASAAGTPMAGVQVFDAIRALDYLNTRPDVDPNRIGIAGLGCGALHAYLAAALEPGFHCVVAVGGTSTYEALVAANVAGGREDNPSAFVPGILRFTDMDRVAACLAPRPVLIAGSAAGGDWPVGGYLRVLRTMRTVYGFYDAADRIHKVAGAQTDDMMPYIADIVQWLGEAGDAETDDAETAVDPTAAPDAASDDQVAELDFSMLQYMQRQIAARAAALPAQSESAADWEAYRQETVDWLRETLNVDAGPPPVDEVIHVSETDGLITEQIALGLDDEYRCPAIVIRPATIGAQKCPAVVLSHDDRQCAASAKISEAAQLLAAGGHWVIIPEHASAHLQSLQGLADAARPRFYGDEAVRLYGPAAAVGLSPIALRVAEDLAAFRYLAACEGVAPDQITLAGVGIGGMDACLSSLLEERVAGTAVINATTLRDWSENAAPDELHFFHIMPHVPSLLDQTDLDLLFAGLAPKPLLVVRLKDGWPRSGFEQVASTTSAIYKLRQAENCLLALGPRDVTEQLESGLTDGVQKQLVVAARTLVPAPPQAGVVGNTDGLRARRSVDSAAGLIWIVGEMDGYDQELAVDGYRLKMWSFFNDNGEAQSGRSITPLLFQTEGNTYKLIGIGTPRANTGTGVQTFPFEPIEGTDMVSEGCVFGWHTGKPQGGTNPGVVEYEDAADAQMIILTGDGEMSGQKLQLGNMYRLQSQYPRRYSVMAVSGKE